MEKIKKDHAEKYLNLMKNYIDSQEESSLYSVELLAKSFIRNQILPDELINLHIMGMKKYYNDIYPQIEHAMDFLLETMISYGMAFQEVMRLRDEQVALKSEIAVAANMQQTLLQSKKPNIAGVDVGAISVPASQMNGDYYHFVENDNGTFGFAVADVIGKGIPAALCMSMIKYSMESFPEEVMRPKTILQNLNRVVERNVEPNMFITMVYANYDPAVSKLTYAFAGHEPGYHYSAREDRFTELRSKGIVLGVLKEAEYEEGELKLEKDDFVIFLTDGVTESREGDRFIEIDEVLDVIKRYVDEDLTAQEVVKKVYRHFERVQNFELKDDFSLLILRKNV